MLVFPNVYDYDPLLKNSQPQGHNIILYDSRTAIVLSISVHLYFSVYKVGMCIISYQYLHSYSLFTKIVSDNNSEYLPQMQFE